MDKGFTFDAKTKYEIKHKQAWILKELCSTARAAPAERRVISCACHSLRFEAQEGKIALLKIPF